MASIAAFDALILSTSHGQCDDPPYLESRLNSQLHCYLMTDTMKQLKDVQMQNDKLIEEDQALKRLNERTKKETNAVQNHIDRML